ncbi:Holliday junction resolvase RuvX [Spirulina sp. 06S082]|uniref:Holliday junction resolvase RuvX n=1 Tax=Spirulina sp. 06S082 TaxID=3110248 RepID=UPI002B1EAD70|nr:Holliday junction resolvase RuvX [Spirulina sp. 06S082]MEA5471479.1 Holliday junction resolvase RuvX [Spirulina sp. 06S082]
MEKLSVLGLDVGRKRIGVAGCDGLGLIATGLTTVIRSSFVKDVEQFKTLVEERQVQLLVVGMPYSMSGAIGFQARQVQKYGKRIGEALSLPVEYMDERLTSVEAEEQMKAQNISPSRNKATIDRKAAAIILQQWLDWRRETIARNALTQA